MHATQKRVARRSLLRSRGAPPPYLSMATPPPLAEEDSLFAPLHPTAEVHARAARLERQQTGDGWRSHTKQDGSAPAPAHGLHPPWSSRQPWDYSPFLAVGAAPPLFGGGGFDFQFPSMYNASGPASSPAPFTTHPASASRANSLRHEFQTSHTPTLSNTTAQRVKVPTFYLTAGKLRTSTP